jgi:arsenate reductase
MRKVIFACVHNAGRSQMSAGFFNKYADASKAHAISAGTQPGDRVHPEVIQVMSEVGVDLSSVKPQRLTPELAQDAEILITMGCGDECPFIPGLRRDDWPLPDPKGRPIEQVKEIRNDIERRVIAFIQQQGLR